MVDFISFQCYVDCDIIQYIITDFLPQFRYNRSHPSKPLLLTRQINVNVPLIVRVVTATSTVKDQTRSTPWTCPWKGVDQEPRCLITVIHRPLVTGSLFIREVVMGLMSKIIRLVMVHEMHG